MTPRAARADVDFSFFYENLSPYGEWVDVDGYGYCFHPAMVDADWQPYTDGYWAYTDAGWTWVSYEDFGDITYHYGRWARVADFGWVWRPDTEWAPAWVSWRSDDRYIGWAPLPPEAVYVPSTGISVGVDVSFGIGPSYYSFCEYRQFGAPVMRHVICPREQNVTIIQNTRNITNITNVTYNNTTVVYNGGPNYQTVSSRSQRPIQALHLERNVESQTRLGSRRVGNSLMVSAPMVRASAQVTQPPSVARKLVAPKLDRGWNQIQDPEAQRKIRTHLAAEVKAMPPQQIAAKPVDVESVRAVLPKKLSSSSSASMTPQRQTTALPDEPVRTDAPTPTRISAKESNIGHLNRPQVRPEVQRSVPRSESLPESPAPMVSEPVRSEPAVSSVPKTSKFSRPKPFVDADPMTVAPQVEPVETPSPRETRPGRIERPQVERPQYQRPQVERPQVERPQYQRPQVERPRFERPQISQPEQVQRSPFQPSSGGQEVRRGHAPRGGDDSDDKKKKHD
jgi:hypothetical protein